ncbi:MAG: efflux RND transporter periplasmic adaptor subunit [Gammaproteobacteria bacterium]|nr:efflux RND transporter periplasmic adaptor subunit [Sideroxydans sp.]MBU3903361.1 efflux RND transporter periplasmic adaptor subunit [Gammaproteobacteria bacterium]MBU4045410.1 efflux RND transporter periplasmic adaptor subunit [Gammaproteobacteria bacterium]
MTLPTSGSQSSRRKKTIIAVMAVAAVAAVALLFPHTKPIPVVLQTVERGIVEASVSNTRAGTVNACRRAKMSPSAGGQIAKLLVKKGQRVKQGQILLELWDNDLHAQESLAQEQLKVALSRVQEVCTLADAAQRDAVRSQELRAKGFISVQQLDRAMTEASAKRSACTSANGDVEQSRSRVRVAKATLERMVLRAPFDGIVADISGELGEYATPSPPGILTIPAIDLIDDSCMYVSAPIDEVDASKLKVGQVSRITLDAIKGRSFNGKVRRIAPYVLDLEKQARTVEVEVEFDKPAASDSLLVGYSADVEIIYETRQNVLRIPTSTLLEGDRVLRYGDKGVLEERVITTGLSNWEKVEVLAGLAEGDRVVSSLDRDGVEAGASVQPETAQPAAK